MKKEKVKDKKFYIEKIGVLEWLKSNDEYQKHRFTNRIEYKKNYKLHREDGPAIEFFDGTGNQYYNEGNRITEEEFRNIRRISLISKMIDN